MNDRVSVPAAALQERSSLFRGRYHAFRSSGDRQGRRLVAPAHGVMQEWMQSLTAAATVVTILVFAAMAMIVTIYVVLFLVEFVIKL